MRSFDLRVRFPTGTILVGGHSAVPGGVSATHSVDREGRPIIPATALRGGLREALESILRGYDRPACDGGNGIEPSATTSEDSPRPCTLDAGSRCIPCRMFGTQRAAIGDHERSFSSLVLGDAVLEGDDAVESLARQHVAVSRTRRSAEDNRLFQRQAPDLNDRVLVARGYSVEPELEPYLEAAARGLMHLGSGRSIGLGRVELEVVWGEDIEAEVPPLASEDDEISIRVRLQSPTALGTADASSNYRATRNEIPGSVLRGAIGFAIARSMPETSLEEAPFQTLVDDHDGAHFGFLYPAERRDASALAGPWPVTARTCKTHPSKHPVVDTLLDRIAVAMLDELSEVSLADRIARVHASTLRNCLASGCSAQLRSTKGTRTLPESPPKRAVTRVSIERRSTSARDGALFSYETLEPGTTFQGSIRNVPAGSRDLLGRALELPIFVGRGVSAGWGKVSVEVVPRPPLPTIKKRGADFESALRGRLSSAGLSTDDIDKLVPITFLAPYLPNDGDDLGTLAAALGTKPRWFTVARRFAREGGWDQRTGEPFAELAVAAGAVYVARLDRPWRESLETLQRLERLGAGQRRHQGFGQLITFDPFILERGDSP
ncbi:MAG: hypothetical protein H6712_00930 [Myxococcales bacterium]|nr:hypothetical protein [Myxococcales bacterium]